MPASVKTKLERIRENYLNILLLLTQVVADPKSRTNIDALFAAADGAGLPRPMVDNSVDGESYSWTAYQQMLIDKLDTINLLIQRAEGPWDVRTRPIF